MSDQQDMEDSYDYQDEPYSDAYAAEAGLSADDPATETGLFAEIQPGLNTYDTYDPESDIVPDELDAAYADDPEQAESQYAYASSYEPPVDADYDTPSNPMLAAPVEVEPEPAPPAPVAALSVADRGATADLSRPPRAQQFRIQRRSQVSTIIPALLIIAFGVLYLLKPISLSPAITVGVLMAALAVSLITRFLLNARRERGLFFIGILLVLWAWRGDLLHERRRGA